MSIVDEYIKVREEKRRAYQREYRRKRRLDPEYRAKELLINQQYKKKNKDKIKAQRRAYYLRTGR